MKKYIFNTKETEYIEDSLYLIEESFQIKLEEDVWSHIKTFEEFVDVIISKFDQEDNDTCTSQQVFYELKSIFTKYGLYDSQRLMPDTRLEDIFPRKYRKTLSKQVEKELGVKVNIVSPSDFTFSCFASFIFGSLIVLIFKEFIPGIVLFLFSVLSFYFVNRFSRKLRFSTVSELIEYIVFCNYIHLRKDKTTVNKKELRKLFFKVYSKELNIDENALQSASFVSVPLAEEDVYGGNSLLVIAWRIVFPIFNYIGLPFRYLFFLLIFHKKPISYLNRPKKEEPKDTWFNQRASNAAVGVAVVIVALILFC